MVVAMVGIFSTHIRKRILCLPGDFQKLVCLWRFLNAITHDLRKVFRSRVMKLTVLLCVQTIGCYKKSVLTPDLFCIVIHQL